MYQNIQHWDITLHFLFSHCRWIGAWVEGVPLSETEIVGNWYSTKPYWFKSPSPWGKLNCDLPIFYTINSWFSMQYVAGSSTHHSLIECESQNL